MNNLIQNKLQSPFRRRARLIALSLIATSRVSTISYSASITLLQFDTGNYEIYNRNDSILSAGQRTVDHDGTVVQVGYFVSPTNFTWFLSLERAPQIRPLPIARLAIEWNSVAVTTEYF